MTNIVLPEGVQYLASNGYIDHYTWGFRPMFIVWIFIAIICFICTIILSSNDEPFSTVTLAGCFITVILALLTLHNTPVYYTEYWVIVEPHALYSQIYDKYSIADTKENITILHPKDPILWNGEPD